MTSTNFQDQVTEFLKQGRSGRMTELYMKGMGEIKWDVVDSKKKTHRLIRTFDGHWYGYENIDTGFLNNKYYQKEILFRMENDPDMGEFKDCSWVRT